jgi:hypothetical protein
MIQNSHNSIILHISLLTVCLGSNYRTVSAVLLKKYLVDRESVGPVKHKCAESGTVLYYRRLVVNTAETSVSFFVAFQPHPGNVVMVVLLSRSRIYKSFPVHLLSITQPFVAV